MFDKVRHCYIRDYHRHHIQYHSRYQITIITGLNKSLFETN